MLFYAALECHWNTRLKMEFAQNNKKNSVAEMPARGLLFCELIPS